MMQDVPVMGKFVVNNFSTYVGLCASTVRKTKTTKHRGQIILLLYLFVCVYSVRTASLLTQNTRAIPTFIKLGFEMKSWQKQHGHDLMKSCDLQEILFITTQKGKQLSGAKATRK